MKQYEITIILTCFNRITSTISCLNSLDDPNLDIQYIITDDGSTDGTADAIRSFASTHRRILHLIEGSGSLFWAGGMRVAIEHYLAEPTSTDYVVLVNDDVIFYPNTLQYMIEYSQRMNGSVITGATCNSSGTFSYGGSVIQRKTAKFTPIPLNQSTSTPCDVFNCNCTLFPDKILRKLGGFDSHYSHSMADYDYALSLKRHGFTAYQTDRYIGQCNNNPLSGSWKDTSLPRNMRIRLKESPKGLPKKEYFYFLKKNFGLSTALWHSLTPYLRILLGI